MNHPGYIGSFSARTEIPYEDTQSGGGLLPDENIYIDTRYRLLINLNDVVEQITVSFDSMGGSMLTIKSLIRIQPRNFRSTNIRRLYF
ncbi:hypothetical protein MGH68_14570 [Erysipelothrix sp. D19-032]